LLPLALRLTLLLTALILGLILPLGLPSTWDVATGATALLPLLEDDVTGGGRE
jgi:hypothetical protein